MVEWKTARTAQFLRDLERYGKKHPSELAAVIRNLDMYFDTLKRSGNPTQVQAGFIHHGPDRIKEIDQKGKTKTKLQQTRLYVFPDIERGTLHLLKIVDKNSQTADIRFSREMVKEIKSGGGY